VALLSLVGFLGFNIEVHHGIVIVIYALLAGAIALWLALTAMRRARRSHTARPRGSVAATVIAGVGIGLATVMLVAFGLFGRELADYGRCMSGANTLAAQQSCYNSFSHALDREVGLLGAQGHG
jgi:small-conductance mechanosensitive channel